MHFLHAMTDNSSSSLDARAARGSLQLSGVRGSVVVVFFFLLAKNDGGGGASFLEGTLFLRAALSRGLSFRSKRFFRVGDQPLLCPLVEIPRIFFCVSTDARRHFFSHFLSIRLLPTSIARR